MANHGYARTGKKLKAKEVDTHVRKIVKEKLADVLELKKNADPAGELAKIRALYPTCSDFERDFPSVCFSLATGVGKTRLMGAFISYLYVAKGIKNYFVMAIH